ncbi:hypothetical protein AK812_SmicGene39486 [Symbiodinium microadriaticum]|uniref:Uncharacterized protein n=1 Tax=Symbiodinium microadriaticum TaxID=2951 RepID=A0A1Q9CBD9_SYMMI|nr:hypothetical protein AK812_SmicGene39486 [Symbiodinium microadriaticum]
MWNFYHQPYVQAGAFGFEFLPGGRLLPVNRHSSSIRLAAGTRGIAQVVPSAYDSMMMVAVSAVALIGLQLVIAEYPRRELDDGACGTGLLRD